PGAGGAPIVPGLGTMRVWRSGRPRPPPADRVTAVAPRSPVRASAAVADLPPPGCVQVRDKCIIIHPVRTPSRPPMPRIAVVLPAYNEESTLGATIRAFRAALPEAEIWVIDNNSTDATHDVAREALRELGAAGGVIHEARKGKGNAMRRAFMDIDADAYVMADADLTYPADQVRLLLDPVLAGAVDMAAGARHRPGHSAA